MLAVNRTIRNAERNNKLPFGMTTHVCQCGVKIFTCMTRFHLNTEFHHFRILELELARSQRQAQEEAKKAELFAAYDELFALAEIVPINDQECDSFLISS